jgi:hypothetical protein
MLTEKPFYPPSIPNVDVHWNEASAGSLQAISIPASVASWAEDAQSHVVVDSDNRMA